jgi:hypothetical protein
LPSQKGNLIIMSAAEALGDHYNEGTESAPGGDHLLNERPCKSTAK